MIEKSRIISLVEEKIRDSALFLLGVHIKPGNVIRVILESDDNVTIQDCVEVSRFIEKHMDREAEDYELKVTSAGLDHPFQHYRQYMKNKDRNVEVMLAGGDVLTGKLTAVDETGIEIVPETKKGSKKSNPEETSPVRISFPEIKQTKLIITF